MKLERQDQSGLLYLFLTTGWRLTVGGHVFELTWTRPNLKHPGRAGWKVE
jgi:hypothetical protein